jgi:outer membrane protein OmpU
MKDIKKVGLTALAGSLAAISANAAEMSVSGATLLTYTSEDPSEVTGNPWGMKTNLAFTASGDVNGYTVSYYQASQDQFAGMSSASLSIDMGDLGKIRFDQGAGSGLNNIDDKTPTAAEEIWDGLDGTTAGGLVGQGNSGTWNYVKSLGDVNIDYAYNPKGGSNSDGSSSGGGTDADSSWGIAITMPIGDAISAGVGYGQISNANNDVGTTDDDEHRTLEPRTRRPTNSSVLSAAAQGPGQAPALYCRTTDAGLQIKGMHQPRKAELLTRNTGSRRYASCAFDG